MAENQSDIIDGTPEEDSNKNKSSSRGVNGSKELSREKPVDPAQRSEHVVLKAPMDSSSSTQADIIKQTMMGKTSNDSCAATTVGAQLAAGTEKTTTTKKMNLGLRGGLFGAKDWDSDSDMNLAFAGYKRSSAAKDNDDENNNSNGLIISKDELESLADPDRGGTNHNDDDENKSNSFSNGDSHQMSNGKRNSNGTTTTSRSSESTTASANFRLSFWPLAGGGGGSSGVEESDPLSENKPATTSDDKPSRISFWPGLEKDGELKQLRNSSVGSDDDPAAPTTSSSTTKVSRISTFRKRDSRARSPRRTTNVGETNNGGSGNNDGSGESAAAVAPAVDLELSRESWSHMRDSLNPNLVGSDVGVDGCGGGRDGSDTQYNRNNQAKFIQSAIKKKQSIFTPLSNFFAGGPSSVDGTNQDHDDINMTLRRVTQYNKGSLDSARDEISKLDMYDADS